MKRSYYIYLFICLIGAFGIYQYSRPARNLNSNDHIDSSTINRIPFLEDEVLVKSQRNSEPETSTESSRSDDKSHLEVCRKSKKIRGTYIQPPSPKFQALSLTSNATDLTDFVLCPGDTIGDLDKTYVEVQDCGLAMYDQGNLIWSSDKLAKVEENMLCAISLQRDGNLVVYKEGMACFYPIGQRPVIWSAWESKTDFKPNKTELRVRDQQFQLVQTLQDGSERVFYAGEDSREFREDLGAPIQVAEKSLMKNHHNDSVILRRNEHIGDINNVHLILQSNCELQLKNYTQIIWSFAAFFKHGENCTLSIQGSSIGIPKIPGSDYNYEGMNILPPNDFTVLQSNITLQGDQLLIIQTLKNGSEVTFYSEPGQDVGLKQKRELRQIASNNITISKKTNFERMDYIGDLDGLHLILQNNCQFKLASGRQDLWNLQQNLNESFMECSLEFNEDGEITFNRLKNNRREGARVQVFGKRLYKRENPPSQIELSLENNMMTMTLQYQSSTAHIYQAGANTNGTWLRLFSERFLIIRANETENLMVPEMSYIGDINGVHVILDKRANLVLYNRSEMIWESGPTQEREFGYAFILTPNGNLATTYDSKGTRSKDYFWCTITSEAYKKAKLVTSELIVNNDGLWLINSYVDGVVIKFRAQEGTDTFALVSNEKRSRGSSSSQIYKL